MGGMVAAANQSLAGRPSATSVPGADYTSVQANPYSPAFSSSQNVHGAPVMSPFARQMAQQQYSPIQSAGLAAMMSALTNQQPQQLTGIAGLPTYRPTALSYRPDMQAVQQNLSRSMPSVYKTDLDSARARIAELEAQQSQSGIDRNGGGFGGS